MSDHEHRICMIVPGFCADNSDWCIPVLRNVVAAVARRADVVVYTLHYPFRRSTYRVAGATVHCLSNASTGKAARLLLWRELARRIAGDHAVDPFTVIHAFWATETGYLATRIARRLGIASVVTIGGGEMASLPNEHYGSQLSAVQRYFVSHSLERATMVTAGSSWVINLLPPLHRIDALRIPLGVDTTMFTPAVRGAGRYRMMAVASLYPWKDIPTLLRATAIALATIPDLTLDVIGEGADHDQLQTLIHKLGIHNAVTLCGSSRHDRLPALYHDHDIFVHAGLYESQGMALLEALATGLPAIATRVGMAADLEGDAVRCVAIRSAEEMAEAIIRSLSNPSHARAAAEYGPSIVQHEAELERCAEKFMRAYSDAVSHIIRSR